MSREILFRGKRVDNGEWVYGYYSFDNRPTSRGTYITCYSGYSQLDYEVIPETVGQYTGLTDKNGKKIFEGDVVEFDRRQQAQPLKRKKGTVFYEKEICAFSVEKEYISQASMLCDLKNLEVIGNIFDNPELIKE